MFKKKKRREKWVARMITFQVFVFFLSSFLSPHQTGPASSKGKIFFPGGQFSGNQ